MSRSRSRLAADWFALLRQNAETGLVEHTDLSALQTEVSTTVNTQLAAIGTQITEVENAVNTTVGSQITAIQTQIDGMDGFQSGDWSVQAINNKLSFRYNNITKALLETDGKFRIDNQMFPFGITATERTITTNQTNLNLRSWAVANGWDGLSELIVTVAPGVYITSNSTGTPAVTVNGIYLGGVTFVNNGSILGMGGNGGAGSNGAGAAGGAALLVQSAVNVSNNGTIAGGGGGGGAGANGNGGQGGGGGGGRTGLTNSAGGARAGGAGTLATAGAGGASVWYQTSVWVPSPDGYSPGYYRYTTYTAGAGSAGGNWGANGTGAGGAGGAGGLAVNGNGLITWQNLGTRNGGVV